MSRTSRTDHYKFSEKSFRDKKKWYKPTKKFKKALKKSRKAKEKQALKTGKEIPLFKKEDVWVWN